MNIKTISPLFCAAAVFSLVANAVTVPDTLKPPASETIAFTLNARGVQIYECRKTADSPAWTFVAPEADLFDTSGAKVGHHFAGPNWQADDGSKVLGKVVAKADAPDKKDIPWLLLTAASHDGVGMMANISSVQRIETEGGIAPSNGCGPEHVGEQFKSNYRAIYVFYHQAKTSK
jgi:hypothetical protein